MKSMRLQFAGGIRRLMPTSQGRLSSHDENGRWRALWQTIGAALLGIVLARWVWLLLSPAGAALPTANGNDPGEAAQLFGTADTHAAQAESTTSNIQLMGVFARKSNGFAIMQVDGKQIGVAQGEEVRPGLRLTETHATYVVLDQGGGTLRVDLQVPKNYVGTSVPSPVTMAPGPGPSPLGGPGFKPRGGYEAHIEALQQRLDAAHNISPQQRKMLERQIENMRGHSR